MSTRCGLRLREIAANTPVLHQLPVSVRHPGTISHGVGCALSCPSHRNESMRRATQVWRATNPSMCGQNHSVSCIFLCTIETIAGEWPNRPRGKGLLRVEAAHEIRLGERQEAPPETWCALCCEPIGESYLRELTTRLSYCSHECYLGHSKLAVSALTEQARTS